MWRCVGGSVECVATLTFYDRLILIISVPVVALILLGSIPLMILYCQNRFDYDDSPTARAARSLARNKIIKIIVFALFLV
jgi:hypothetical protein